MKIFLDANIFVAACGSSTGGSSYLFRVAEQEPTWHCITSPYAIQEARVNIQKKLPQHIDAFQNLLLSPSLTIIAPPPASVVAVTERVIAEKDAPILAAALIAQADYLCTLDQKDFHTIKVKTWARKYGITVSAPSDLLKAWRNTQLQRS